LKEERAALICRGMTMPTANPLLDFTDLPRFDAIRPEHVAPAVDQLLQEAEAALERVVQPAHPPPGAPSPARWTWPPSAWAAPGAPSPPEAVVDTPELRAAYNEACRASPSSSPGWAPTSACTPSTRPSPA
jgi:hypothetical protein